MTEHLLIDAVRKKVKDVVKDFRLETRFEEHPRCPTVFEGDLPPKRSNSTDDFPFVIVRFEESSSTNDEITASVLIVAGCFTEDLLGHRDCMNVLTRIRTALLTMPNGILDDRYILQPPIKITNLPEQPYPQWQINMETKWCFRAPELEF